MKLLHLLKPGTFVADDGAKYTFSADDIRDIAESYDPQLSEAPIVIGHPQTDAPAYGWLDSARADADGVFAVPKQVQPAFAEQVKAGAYKKISVALFGKDNPSNPKPGHWYIRHVGFFGAHPPAVKDLQPVQFAAPAEGCITVSLSEPDEGVLLRALARLLAGSSGAAIAASAGQALEAALIRPASPAANPELSDPTPEQLMSDQTTTVALAEANAEIARLKKANADHTAAAKASADETRRQRWGAFFAEQKTKVLPVERPLLIELAMKIEDGQTVQLSERAEDRIDLDEGLRKFVTGLPDRVFIGLAMGAAPGGRDAPQFAAPPGYSVNATRADLDARARSRMAANPTLTYEAAIAAVDR